MDLTEFRVIRTPLADDLGSLRLRDEIPAPATSDGPMTHVPPPAPPITVDNLPPEFGSIEDNPLEEIPLTELETPLQRIYYVINEANTLLRRANDWMKGTDLAKAVLKLRTEASIADLDWPFPVLIAQLCLTEWLVQSLLEDTPEGYTRATALTRLVLVSDLIGLNDATLGQLDEAAIFAQLNQRSVILPKNVTSAVTERSQIQLIREATVSDLHVIRREWACYVLGEVANVRNLMGGESFSQTQTQLREQETIATTDMERQEQEEQENSSKLASELSQEVNTQLNLSVNGYVDASVSYKTPVATINIAGGVDVGLSIQRGERFASKVAREAVTRAVRRVDTRTRETRSERELRRNEDVMHYELTNKGDNLHAVYRWVDRVDRYQLFRYTDRLQLEFQLPEPAEFYRKRSKVSATAAASVDKPPDEFKVTLAEITEAKLLDLAAKYRASNLPAVPDEKISLSRTITLEIAKEALPAANTEVNCPTQAKDLDIPIPTNYRAVGVTYSGHGYPMWGRWQVGSTTVVADKTGFHSGFAAVSVGDQTKVSWVGGYDKKADGTLTFFSSYNDNRDKGSVGTVQASDQDGNLPVRSVLYGRATLVIGQDTADDLQPVPEAEITLTPGVSLSLKVGLSTAGLASSIVTFLVTCKRTDEAVLAWKLSVYDALFAAWSQWKKEYASAQLRQALAGGSGSDAGSSQRNEQIIREELKRQVISWLLDEEAFEGRPALLAAENKAKFKGIDFDEARKTAATIQFLEQAFEWGNMMYMFYPYYWADASEWQTLSSLTANDPEFERFLRAGSARVVVPARPGFNDAVKNWLVLQRPFITGQLPSPDHELFVAIDREIRDLTASWDGGKAEDWWEARVSTTLLYLEEDGTMPIENAEAVLPIAKNAVFKAAAICQDD